MQLDGGTRGIDDADLFLPLSSDHRIHDGGDADGNRSGELCDLVALSSDLGGSAFGRQNGSQAPSNRSFEATTL